MTEPHEIAPVGAAAEMAMTFQKAGPHLTTDHLILRMPQIADFDAYADIILSSRFPHGSGLDTRHDAWADFSNYVAGWILRGTGIWTIVAQDGGAVLGFISCGMEPGDRETELGWLLTEKAEGQGIAYEAAKAVRDFAIEKIGVASLVSYIDRDNTRSIKLAERLGADRDAASEKEIGEPVFVYRHPTPEVLQ